VALGSGFGFGLPIESILTFLSFRTRPGERVAKRRRCKSKIGSNHKINQSETIKWFKNRFDGIVR
jgi:large subunit ribosomal protein L11e